MKRTSKITLTLFIGLSLLFTSAGLTGCGSIADKNSLKVAKFENSYITRGDLLKLVRDMGDTERPNLDTTSAWLKLLNDHIDKKISLPLGDQLASEGKIQVSRELAQERFLSGSGDNEEMYRFIFLSKLPEDGTVDPLMESYNLTPELMKAMKSAIEDGIAYEIRLMQAQRAIEYLGEIDYGQGLIALDNAVLEREYEFLKPALLKLEWIHFLGIRFPSDAANAVEQASTVRKRVNEGGSFEAMTQKVLALPRSNNPLQPSVIESEIENNPAVERFRGFWIEASGTKVGDVLGPVFIPEYQQQMENSQGQVVTKIMPAAFLVIEVLDYRSATTMTFEEAKPRLIPPLLAAEEMKKLRKEHGVEIYREMLPDPSRM